jgi:hypothetical protein
MNKKMDKFNIFPTLIFIESNDINHFIDKAYGSIVVLHLLPIFL